MSATVERIDRVTSMTVSRDYEGRPQIAFLRTGGLPIAKRLITQSLLEQLNASGKDCLEAWPAVSVDLVAGDRGEIISVSVIVQ